MSLLILLIFIRNVLYAQDPVRTDTIIARNYSLKADSLIRDRRFDSAAVYYHNILRGTLPYEYMINPLQSLHRICIKIEADGFYRLENHPPSC